MLTNNLQTFFIAFGYSTIYSSGRWYRMSDEWQDEAHFFATRNLYYFLQLSLFINQITVHTYFKTHTFLTILRNQRILRIINFE
jgi:hypothetical protein